MTKEEIKREVETRAIDFSENLVTKEHMEQSMLALCARVDREAREEKIREDKPS